MNWGAGPEAHQGFDKLNTCSMDDDDDTDDTDTVLGKWVLTFWHSTNRTKR